MSQLVITILFIDTFIILFGVFLQMFSVNKRLARLEARQDRTTDRIVELERVVINRTEPGRGSQLWYVIREQPIPGFVTSSGLKGLTVTWATADPARLASIKQNKYYRFFMTTVISYSSNDAMNKSEDSRKWKELFRDEAADAL